MAVMTKDYLEYYIGQRLTDLANINVYNAKVPDDATFPYLVFKFLSSSYEDRRRADWILEVDYWDDKTDNSAIKQASEYVKNGRLTYIGLDFSTQSETEGFYRCYLDFDGEVPEIEPNITRQNQRFLLKVG